MPPEEKVDMLSENVQFFGREFNFLKEARGGGNWEGLEYQNNIGVQTQDNFQG